MAKKPLIGLVMMVKNEAEPLAKYLPTVLPLIDSYTICDTGSDDRTVETARELLGGVPGRILKHKWQNFGHNLTLAHRAAKGSAQWLLWLHADMSLEVDAPAFRAWFRKRSNFRVDYWKLWQIEGNTWWRMPLMVSGALDWRYVGPTHEYLDTQKRPWRFLDGIAVHHHADGANREHKLERDLELLTPGFNEGDPRATFYMAQTLRFMGKTMPAIAAYNMRARMEEGWGEERWYATFQSAALKEDVEELIGAWRERPWRHEPLLAAARIVGRKGYGNDQLFLEAPP